MTHCNNEMNGAAQRTANKWSPDEAPVTCEILVPLLPCAPVLAQSMRGSAGQGRWQVTPPYPSSQTNKSPVPTVPSHCHAMPHGGTAAARRASAPFRWTSKYLCQGTTAPSRHSGRVLSMFRPHPLGGIHVHDAGMRPVYYQHVLLTVVWS